MMSLRKRVKHTCIACGGNFTDGHKLRHETSRRHKMAVTALSSKQQAVQNTPIESYQAIGEVLRACGFEAESIRWPLSELNSFKNIRLQRPNDDDECLVPSVLDTITAPALEEILHRVYTDLASTRQPFKVSTARLTVFRRDQIADLSQGFLEPR